MHIKQSKYWIKNVTGETELCTSKMDVNSTGNKLFLINAYASELHKEKHLSLKTTLLIAGAFSVSECDFYTRQHTQGSHLARHRTEFKKNPCVKEKYHLYILVPVTEIQWLSLKKLFFLC